ncbi:MAG: hypothetical protein J5723_03110 [Ruminococcus sp.]|nr:hypothetical protein [Ruminococcus sp.]
MKKTIICICVSAAILCCGASCGSHPVSNEGVTASVDATRTKSDEELISEIAGKWETSAEFIGGVEKDEKEIIKKRYELIKDGNGFYYTSEDEKQFLRWKVTADGGIDVNYEEMGEKIEHFDYIGYDLSKKTITSDGELVECFSRVGDFTKPISQ